MELVTGRAGSPHITSQQDRQKHQGVWGTGAYILKTGNNLEPVVQSSNNIQIKDGALVAQGALFSVKVGTVDEVTIANGSQGMQRKDVIVARYTYNQGANTEKAEWAVVQGAPVASNPQIPQITEGDIQAGDATVDTAVFVVTLDGVNITGVDIVPETAPDLEEIKAQLDELNGNNKVYKWEQTAAPYGSGTMTVSIYRIGRSCFANVTWTGSTLQSGETLGEFSIPTAFRPIAGAYGSCMNVVGVASAETSTRIWITNNGTVQYVTDDTRSVERRLSISYLAASAALPGDEYLV